MECIEKLLPILNKALFIPIPNIPVVSVLLLSTVLGRPNLKA